MLATVSSKKLPTSSKHYTQLASASATTTLTTATEHRGKLVRTVSMHTDPEEKQSLDDSGLGDISFETANNNNNVQATPQLKQSQVYGDESYPKSYPMTTERKSTSNTIFSQQLDISLGAKKLDPIGEDWNWK